MTKLLICTGYDSLLSLSKLNSSELIEELESYATDYLDASDLGLSEAEWKYYFSVRTKKFKVLPGHKHLVLTAAEFAFKLLHLPENEAEYESEKISEDHDQSSVDDGKSPQQNCIDFLSEFSSHSNGRSTRSVSRGRNSSLEKTEFSASVDEEERVSLIEFLKTWIARKELSGLLEPFVFDIDYRVQVYRPKSSNQSAKTTIYSFVCLRCNTTIRAFKRANGQNWNAANVCRHISTIHFHIPPSKTPRPNNLKPKYLTSSLSTPPLSDSPIEQDPLD